MSKVPNVLLLLGCSVRDGNSGKTILSTTEHVKAYIEKKFFYIIKAYITGQSKTVDFRICQGPALADPGYSKERRHRRPIYL